MLDPTEFGKAMAGIVREATAPLLRRIEQLEARQPEKGAPGRDADPIDVKDVVAELLSGLEIKTMVDLHVAESVQKFFEANPLQHGKDGRDGRDGKDGERGVGDRGEKGEPGTDGIGLAGAMIDREGCLIVTTTKGEPMKLGTVIGRDGDPGKDGADLSTVSIEFDGLRTLAVKAKDGEIAKTYKLDIPMDVGYWREGMDCAKSDIVTHAGNAWLALRDTKAKPCVENKDDWRLFARKGRDGVDGRSGRDLGPVPPVNLNA